MTCPYCPHQSDFTSEQAHQLEVKRVVVLAQQMTSPAPAPSSPVSSDSLESSERLLCDLTGLTF